MDWDELHMMNWDDLRIIQAVGHEGSYAGAAATLRIDETTVSRRLTRIERALGVTLFEAVDGVRKPTASCELGGVAYPGDRQSRGGDRKRRQRDDGPGGPLPHRLDQLDRRGDSGSRPHFTADRKSGPHHRAPAPLARRSTSRAGRPISRFVCSSPSAAISPFEKLADTQLYFFEPADTVGADSRSLVCCYPERLDRSPETEFLKSRGLQSTARCITENARVIRNLILLSKRRGNPARLSLRGSVGRSALERNAGAASS